MKAHLCEHSNRRSLGALSTHGCTSSFLDWVINFRPGISKIGPEELLMCPMLWCRENFKTNALAIEHIKKCSYLENAWYWCPSCSRPERFFLCDKGCDISELPRLRRKKSRLVRAVTYLNVLGRRRSSKAGTGL